MKNLYDTLLEITRSYQEKFLHLLPRLIIALILFFIFIFIAVRLGRLLQNKLFHHSNDPLLARFISLLVKYGLIICGIILTLQIIGLSKIAGGLLAGAGLSAFIVGFAFKDIAENFLAGVILAFDRPFLLNDTIKINDLIGQVISLDLRTTHIRTFDEKDIFIPNATIIKEPVTNLTRNGLIRIDFELGIAYEDDIAAAAIVIKKSINKLKDIESEPKPFVTVEGLSTNAVILRIYFWTKTYDYKRGALLRKSKVIKTVKESLLKQGFTFPANIQELKLYGKRDSIPLSIINKINEPNLKPEAPINKIVNDN